MPDLAVKEQVSRPGKCALVVILVIEIILVCSINFVMWVGGSAISGYQSHGRFAVADHGIVHFLSRPMWILALACEILWVFSAIALMVSLGILLLRHRYEDVPLNWRRCFWLIGMCGFVANALRDF